MKVVLFDGVCNFCSASVQFIIARDKKSVFHFAALQSDAGKDVLAKHHLSQGGDPESIVLVDGDRTYTHSSAALRIAKDLSFPWFFGYVFLVVPRFLRDAVYRVIAKNRYRWWGKKDACMVPTPELRARFL